MKRPIILHSAFGISILYSALHHCAGRLLTHGAISALLIGVILCIPCWAQNPLPFQVLNPKKQQWSPEEATRIYVSACTLVARAIRPEAPPQLHPRFVFVLGAQNDETVRNGSMAEVHLRNWNPQAFAHAMVIMATREVLQSEQLQNLTHDVLLAAQASVTVNELKHEH
jgi:hypothetical protein